MDNGSFKYDVVLLVKFASTVSVSFSITTLCIINKEVHIHTNYELQ